MRTNWYRDLKKAEDRQKKSRINIVGFAGFCALILILSAVLESLATRTITNTGDNVDTFIRNSKGNYWAATGANLQDAIDDLANLSGWVYVPSMITLTNPLKIGNGCTLWSDGVGGLTQGNNNNKTLIVNYDTTNWHNNITIRGLRLEGNGLNQPEWYNGGSLMNRYANGIYFTKTIFSTIQDVIINDTAGGGIYIDRGRNNLIDNCKIYSPGKLYEDSGTGYDQWASVGMWMYNGSDTIISNCLVNDSYTAGIVIESYTGCPVAWRNYGFTVTNCVVTDTSFGYYFEEARDCVISNCVSKGCTDIAIYGGAAGYYAHSTTNRISFNGCESYQDAVGVSDAGIGNSINDIYVYRSSGAGGTSSTNASILLSGQNTTVKGGTLEYPRNHGIYSEAFNTTISDVTIKNASLYGIQYTQTAAKRVRNPYGMIQNCVIDRPGNDGINCYMANITIQGNTIRNSAHYGIYIGSTNFVRILNNYIIKANTGIIYVASCNKGQISGNYLYGGSNWGYGLLLSSSKRFNVYGNTIEQSAANTPDYAITESGTADYNFIHDNYLNMTTATAKITRVGANTIVTGNYGNYSLYLPSVKPAAPVAGMIYVNTTTGDIAVYTGAAWVWNP